MLAQSRRTPMRESFIVLLLPLQVEASRGYYSNYAFLGRKSTF
jgi:hypothetical protein